MPKRLVTITAAVLTVLSCYSYADIIYLKNGDIIRGEVIGEDKYTVTVRSDDNKITDILSAEIKKIVNYDEIKTENDHYSDAMFELEGKLDEDAVNFAVGPQLGIYEFSDGFVSKYHKTGPLIGASVGIWKGKKYGVRLEFESYDSTYNGSVLVNNGSLAPVALSYSERLTLMPLWISYLHIFKKQPVYIGGGIGTVNTVLIMKTGPTEFTIRNNFSAYQLVIGYIYKKLGLTLKYSSIETNQYWGNLNYGGYSFLINLFL